MSVKVAVRVRPFNAREIELNSELCVEMEGNTTILKEPNGKTRPFSFDYSFWSHDEFEIDENGIAVGTSDKYADQRKVYDQVGKEVLDNAYEGYHCCLFAYGQTGAGKSYSMIGYQNNKGIVPIATSELFDRIKSNTDPDMTYEVTVSMLEIYNEKIQDLLIDIKNRPLGGLKVRECKKYGVYVEQLTTWAVDSYDAIEEKMSMGNENRTIGATQMNATSSRAHTIITINFKQIQQMEQKKVEKLSVINLVDLAGSEKASKTNATGERLKEGSNINKSLTTLGLVISTLAEKSTGKAKGKVVPYRNSALTRILQNALGGNSKTLMICAISPSNNNFDETLSTLRYADAAKKIKCQAVINESETDKIIRELKEENEKLKELFAKLSAGNGDIPSDLSTLMERLGGIGAGTNGSEANPSTNDTDADEGNNSKDYVDEKNEDLLRKLKETEEMLAANAMMMAEYEKSYAEKLKESKQSAIEHHQEFDSSYPHISNINEDHMLTGKFRHSFKNKDKILVGRANGVPKPDIIISAIGIRNNHAEFVKESDDEIFIVPASEDCCEYIHLNGEIVTEKQRLFHLDRVVFCTGTAFIFKDEANADFKRTMVEEKDIDFEYCQREMTKVDQMEIIVKKVEEDNVQKKLEENERVMREYENELLQIKIKMENAQMEQHNKAMEKEFKEMQMEFEMKKMQRDFEVEKHKQEILEQEQKKLNKEKERRILEEKLAKYVPLITEVNLISADFKRDISMMPYLTYHFSENNDITENDQLKRLKIKIKVENYEEGYSYIWDLNKFHERYFMIKELLDTYFETNEIPKMKKEQDPFWDPPEPQLIGQGFLKLLSIAYLLDNPTELILVGDNGKIGLLRVNLLPADDIGTAIDPDTLLDEELVEDPRELLERRLDFVLQIDDAELPEEFCSNVFCKYSIKYDDRVEYFETNVVAGKNPQPVFNYKKHHYFESVSEATLGYLLNANLCIEVYGNEDKKDQDELSQKSSEESKPVSTTPTTKTQTSTQAQSTISNKTDVSTPSQTQVASTAKQANIPIKVDMSQQMEKDIKKKMGIREEQLPQTKDQRKGKDKKKEGDCTLI